MVRVIGRQKLASGGNSGSYLLGANFFNLLLLPLIGSNSKMHEKFEFQRPSYFICSPLKQLFISYMYSQVIQKLHM